jgi:hypothetical protein
MFLYANSSRPAGSFRQHTKTKVSFNVQLTRKPAKLLTDVDHYFTLKESCAASLRSDRHQIGLTDLHHRNPHTKHYPYVAHSQMNSTTQLGRLLGA